jgi:hypothetical protein
MSVIHVDFRRLANVQSNPAARPYFAQAAADLFASSEEMRGAVAAQSRGISRMAGDAHALRGDALTVGDGISRLRQAVIDFVAEMRALNR